MRDTGCVVCFPFLSGIAEGMRFMKQPRRPSEFPPASGGCVGWPWGRLRFHPDESRHERCESAVSFYRRLKPVVTDGKRFRKLDVPGRRLIASNWLEDGAAGQEIPPAARLFVAQRLNRVEPRRLPRGVKPEGDADKDRDADRRQNRRNRDFCRPALEPANPKG